MNNTAKIILIVIVALIAGFVGFSIGETNPVFAVLILLGVVAFIIYSLSGNRKSESATAAQRAEALSLTPETDKVRIYIVRSGFVAKLQGMDVSIGGQRTGQMKGGQFLFAELDPGTYTVIGELARSGKNSGTSMEVSLEAGEAAAIKATIEMGMVAGKVKFERVRGETAKSAIEDAKMIRWTTPAAPAE